MKRLGLEAVTVRDRGCARVPTRWGHDWERAEARIRVGGDLALGAAETEAVGKLTWQWFEAP